MKQVFLVFAMLMGTGCHGGDANTPPPMEVGDSICISGNFYKVKNTSAYPWVHMSANDECQTKTGMPDSYVDFSKIPSFNPDCVCRYSAACQTHCKGEIGDARDTCLEGCKLNGP